jgi:uncharacterized protein (TIGR02466 family)
MTTEPIYLFPTSVLKRSYDKAFLNELEYIKTKIKYRDGYDHAFSEEVNILEKPELVKIKKFIQETLDYYMEDIWSAVERVVPTISWTNLNTKGAMHSKHWHSNSILSGVFYFQTTESTPITFYNPIPHTSLQVEYKNITPFNALSHDTQIESGDVIIFPSPLLHSVSYNQNDEDRYSLAFNTFTKDGIIGSKEKLTFLGRQEQINE